MKRRKPIAWRAMPSWAGFPDVEYVAALCAMTKDERASFLLRIGSEIARRRELVRMGFKGDREQ